MPPKRLPRKKSSPNRRTTKRTAIGKMSGGVVADTVTCADFVAGDQTVTYGYTARDMERLIDKVLAFLQAGAAFLPAGDALCAGLDGETLTFHLGAIQQLGRKRNERAYLLSLTVRREFQIWATKFIPLAGQMDRKVVTGLDMPVAYSEFCIPRPGEGPEARLATVPLADITEALDKHPAFVILGEPGAGKTTTLQKIAYERARALLGDASGRVPLFVRLSQQGNRTPIDFLRAEWEERTGVDLADALADGRVLLLADGINELPREDRDERLKAWRLFTTDYGQANQIVFTSRERDYDRQLDLPRVRVEPLDDERIADYLKRNDAARLASQLDDPKARLREMARNPFNLSLLVHAWKSNQREMANRGRLLEWFVGELFSREERLAHRGWIHRDVQTAALARLAYQMQTQGESTTFPVKTARSVLPQSIEIQGEEVAFKPSDLFRFARAATILDPTIDPDIRFYHHLLQECFAALELLRRFDGGEDLAALWRCERLTEEMPPVTVGEWDSLPEPPATGWEVTTILACGLAEDAARLIDAVRPHNPVLAGRCLDEAGIAKPERVTKQVRADLLADLYNPAVHLRARLQAGLTLGCISDPRFEPQPIDGIKVILPTMVRVPAGKYIVGSASDMPNSHGDEKPQHEIDMPSFGIGRWPVTNAEFACFIEGGGYKDVRYWTTDSARHWLSGGNINSDQIMSRFNMYEFLKSDKDWQHHLEDAGSYWPGDLKDFELFVNLSRGEFVAEILKIFNAKSRERPQYWNYTLFNNPSQPVVGITLFEAQAYCEWLSFITGLCYRLPTELEWEVAGRGQHETTYPWGNTWDIDRANTIEGHVLKTSPVGIYAAAGGTGPFNTEDQAGNVWEWTISPYFSNAQTLDNTGNYNTDAERVIRGGSWGDSKTGAMCTFRFKGVPGSFGDSLGFRVLSTSRI